jgi:hypothetical protein
MVGTGSAVSPVYPLLICAKLATRPIRRSATLRRFKAFPSLVRLWFSDRARFGRSFPGTHQVRVTRMLRPVSQSTGVSTRTHLSEGCGALI